MDRNLWLVGMMGSGKTAVGRLVARELAVPFVDTDAEIASRHGRSIGELWETDGEEAFREEEASEVLRLSSARGCVVATGGGAVLRPESVEAMRASGLVVWLDAPAEALLRRVGSGTGRPLLAGGPERLASILEARRAIYRAAAHRKVSTGGREPAEVAAEVIGLWTGS